MSVPAIPPPQYTDASPTKSYGTAPTSSNATEPLLASQRDAIPPTTSSGPNPNRNAWIDDAASLEDGPTPDDGFKINVEDCDRAVRLSFIRKVYSILLVQLTATTVVAAGMHTAPAIAWTRENSWAMFVPMVLSFGFLIGTYIKRHQHPANLILLGLFTLCESLLVGTVTSYYESTVVLQALAITVAVFVGLSLFTFQTKYDFSSFGPFLMGGLMGLIGAGLVQLFFPFGKTAELVVACFGVVLFSGYVVFDTQNIIARYSVDEYIAASLALYLDFINLFLYILRVLNNSNRD